ncbi:Hypothetical_protein [Hexamita inflata]|uniref:Hypothetical_protein n=1 Tax=Hexamita inflata TaxID=28002 RepID=A0AA86QEA4_9EUKA|nr:Hypothetical protein HINF_LOCUS22477 [Hexamita inflata]CAI9940368.1 Hypothetical protein HINF_LOCUS28013 [Hexamita inflata]CAI9957646.1 Hypothetical protein HINF_LOCUS45291 [Hexamita inflata]CAI9963699.1 Hypothetical protein HINF_LOCUS51344 [Hexamita inflata]CAI9964569.1 Hypothetical protein HINF_LOCUS52214 [Hexamita inflata]
MLLCCCYKVSDHKHRQSYYGESINLSLKSNRSNTSRQERITAIHTEQFEVQCLATVNTRNSILQFSEIEPLIKPTKQFEINLECTDLTENFKILNRLQQLPNRDSEIPGSEIHGSEQIY